METGELISRTVRRKLNRLGRAIRAQLAAEAVAAAWVAAVAVGAVTLLCDWGVYRLTGHEVGGAQRVVVMVAALAVAGWIVWRVGGRRMMIRLSDADLALIVERHYPILGDRLISAVQFASPDRAGDASTALLERMARQANETAERLDFLAPLNRLSLLRRLALAAAVAAAPAAMAMAAPAVLNVWFSRNVLLVDTPWRAKRNPALDTYLVLDGGPVFTVVRGDDLPVVVRVRPGSRVVPEQVTLCVRVGDWPVASEWVDRTAGSMRYPATLRRVTEPLEFWAAGGDGRSPVGRVRVIEPAKVRGVWFTVEYPGYMNRPARRFDGRRGGLAAPPGAWITVEAMTTKPLEAAAVLVDGRAVGRTAVGPVRFDAAGAEAPGFVSRFGLAPPADDAPTVLLRFELTDADGYPGRAETTFPIHIQYDQPPELTVDWLASAAKVTPRAVIGAVIDVRDDCGVVELRAEVTVAAVSGGPRSLPIRTYRKPRRQDTLAEHNVDLSSLGLTPGDTIRLSIAAVDSLPVSAGGPNLRRSEPRRFSVISEDDLRAELLSQQKQMRLRMDQAMEAQAVAIDRMRAARDQARPGGTPAESRRLATASASRQQTAATFAASIAATYRTLLAVRDSNRIDEPAKRAEIRRRLQLRIIDPLSNLVQTPMPEALALIDAAVAAEVVDADPLARIAELQQRFYDRMDRVRQAMVQLEGAGELTRMLSGVIDVSEEVKRGIDQRLKTKTGELFDAGER